MLHLDMSALETAVFAAPDLLGDTFVKLGLMFSIGMEVPADRVAAHKWFNLAAFKGNAEAVRLRKELAAEMSEDDIAEAQRAAREWISTR